MFVINVLLLLAVVIGDAYIPATNEKSSDVIAIYVTNSFNWLSIRITIVELECEIF